MEFSLLYSFRSEKFKLVSSTFSVHVDVNHFELLLRSLSAAKFIPPTDLDNKFGLNA